MATTLTTGTVSLSDRQRYLIGMSMHLLRQAHDLVEQMDDATYSECPSGLAPHRVGGHLRHVLEFYECFLDGVDSSHIDYDKRKRDSSVESSRVAAMDRIRLVIEGLRQPLLLSDALVWVRTEDLDDDFAGDPFVTSSIGRELQALSSHTIHHFALIALTLHAHGVKIAADFGMAPSTLRYRSDKRGLRRTSEAA